MSYDAYHKRKIGEHVLKPETQMMGYGYDPSLSEGSLKPPIFLTSTFVFKTAQDGKDFFDYTSGRREPRVGQAAGLVYSRFNNPNLEVLEDRLALWEQGETAAVFSSGMSAISTALFAYVRPGDVILMSQPLYGGTETLIEKTLPAFGVSTVGFAQGHDKAAVKDAAERASARAREKGGRVCLIMTETPANPTNSLVDLALMRDISAEHRRPAGGRAASGAGGQHVPRAGVPAPARARRGSGAVFADQIRRRSFRSGRRRRGRRAQRRGADQEAARRAGHSTRSQHCVDDHALDGNAVVAHAQGRAERSAGRRLSRRRIPKIAGVNYLGFLAADDPRKAVFERQCLSAGSTFGFSVKGGEAEAFRLLDGLQFIKLAVSLGGTETLISHPASTTHSGVSKETRDRIGISDALDPNFGGYRGSRTISSPISDGALNAI